MRMHAFLRPLAGFLLFGLAFVVLLAIGMQIARADDLVAAPAPSILVDIWQIVQPLAALFVSIVGPALIAWIAGQIITRLNISNDAARKAVEAQVRDALHKAALNGLKFAMSRAGLATRPGLAISVAGTIAPPVIRDAIEYVQAKNPQTMEQAGIGTQDLEEIILSKVPDVLVQLAQAKAPLELAVATR